MLLEVSTPIYSSTVHYQSITIRLAPWTQSTLSNPQLIRTTALQELVKLLQTCYKCQAFHHRAWIPPCLHPTSKLYSTFATSSKKRPWTNYIRSKTRSLAPSCHWRRPWTPTAWICWKSRLNWQIKVTRTKRAIMLPKTRGSSQPWKNDKATRAVILKDENRWVIKN